jgi:hypothetical protein
MYSIIYLSAIDNLSGNLRSSHIAPAPQKNEKFGVVQYQFSKNETLKQMTTSSFSSIKNIVHSYFL